MNTNSLPKEIQTERLKLVPITEELYRNLYGSYEMGAHISLHLDDLKHDQRLHGWGAWIAFDQSGAPVGDMGFKGRPDKAGKVEIGYGVQEPYQGNGYATEGVQGLIDWAFSFPEVREVTAECYEDNVASIRVLEKLGFERTAQTKELVFWRLRDGY
ncbi:GNAT family N-acetyltransferase [Planococcus plakortidis]|uniref:GNAT family N-acetyltransferase n=1 Tax=Planococcus plakortidis TaxID=1038856 RepID=UPI003984776A